MITFITELDIVLPRENEEDYFSNLSNNIAKFLGKEGHTYVDTTNVSYVCSGRKNQVSFKWTDKKYTGEATGEQRIIECTKKMEYWFKHCPFFRKHNVSNFTTSWVTKG